MLAGPPPDDWHALGHELSKATGLDPYTALQKAVGAVVIGSPGDLANLRARVADTLESPIAAD
jgi:hypothetical protein